LPLAALLYSLIAAGPRFDAQTPDRRDDQLFHAAPAVGCSPSARRAAPRSTEVVPARAGDVARRTGPRMGTASHSRSRRVIVTHEVLTRPAVQKGARLRALQPPALAPKAFAASADVQLWEVVASRPLAAPALRSTALYRRGQEGKTFHIHRRGGE
jgi:hypothetical protein